MALTGSPRHGLVSNMYKWHINPNAFYDCLHVFAMKASNVLQAMCCKLQECNRYGADLQQYLKGLALLAQRLVSFF